jgi:hypothetical protein
MRLGCQRSPSSGPATGLAVGAGEPDPVAGDVLALGAAAVPVHATKMHTAASNGTMRQELLTALLDAKPLLQRRTEKPVRFVRLSRVGPADRTGGPGRLLLPLLPRVSVSLTGEPDSFVSDA